MSPELTSGLILMVVGMVTVFVILFLVVFSTRILTLVVNKYFPAKKLMPVWERQAADFSRINPKILSAILATVEIVTKGKGKVSKIERTSYGKSN